MSNIDNGADYGKMYLFLGQLKDDWMNKADANNDGEVTAGEFCWFINESKEWDTDTLGNRPDNDIIHNFFSNMLDINNTSQHYLDQAEIDKVFEDEENIFKLIAEFTASLIKGQGTTTPDTPETEIPNKRPSVDTSDEVQSTGGAGGAKGSNGTFDGDVNWTNASTSRTVEEGSQVSIDDLVGSASGVSFSATATGGLNVNCDSATGKITLTAPDVNVDTNYTITLTATDEDGDTIKKDITLTVNTDDEVSSTPGGGGAKTPNGKFDGNVTWKTQSKLYVDSSGKLEVDTISAKYNVTFEAEADEGLRCNVHPETGKLTIYAPHRQEDEEYNVTIKAIDPDGDFVTKTITVKVWGAVDTSDNRGS